MDAVLLERLVAQAADFVVARLAEIAADPVQYFEGRAARLKNATRLVAAADARVLAVLAAERAIKGGQVPQQSASLKSGYDRAQLEALLATAALFATP